MGLQHLVVEAAACSKGLRRPGRAPRVHYSGFRDEQEGNCQNDEGLLLKGKLPAMLGEVPVEEVDLRQLLGLGRAVRAAEDKDGSGSGTSWVERAANAQAQGPKGSLRVQ